MSDHDAIRTLQDRTEYDLIVFAETDEETARNYAMAEFMRMAQENACHITYGGTDS